MSKVMLDSVKIVRGGRVQTLTPAQARMRKKKVGRRKMSPKQKAALKKARSKAHTGGAARKRAKSMKVRRSKIG